MNKKNSCILVLIILSIIAMPLITAKSFDMGDIEDFYYADGFVPDVEISWRLAKIEDSGYSDWEIIPGQQFQQDDIFKLKFTEDPDDLTFTTIEEIQETSDEWAEFYLNNVLLGDDASQINWYINETSLSITSPVIWMYLLPNTLKLASGNVGTFDYLYDTYKPLEYDNDSGKFTVWKTDGLFHMKIERHYWTMLFVRTEIKQVIVSTEIKQELTVSYNTESGYLDKVDLYKYRKGDTKIEFHAILLNTESTQKVPFNLVSGLIALMIIGLATITNRKRRG